MTACLLLLTVGLILRFAFRAYDFLGYTLMGGSVLCLAWEFSPCVLFPLLCAAVLLLLSVVCVIELRILRGARSDDPGGCSAMILLGASVIGTRLSPALERRVEAALPVLRSDPQLIAVLSGGRTAFGDISEAEAMYRRLTAEGIDPSRLYREDQSRTTFSNLRNSFRLLRSLGLMPGPDTLVVTSPYHMYRARLISRQLGVSPRMLHGRHGRPLSTVNSYYREAFAVIKYYVTKKRGWNNDAETDD